MENIIPIMIDKLEYIIAGIGIICVPIYIKFKGTNNESNNLTEYVIKQRKIEEAISNRGRSIF